MVELKTAKLPRLLEAFVEVVAKLVGVYLVYLGFNWLAEDVFGATLSQDTLQSLLLLPALYVLKDAPHIVIEPLTVKVEQHSDKMSVVRGITPRVRDTLEFKSVENTEIITTPLGWVLNYATVRLYSPGGHVEIPNVYRASDLVETINSEKKCT